MTEKIPALIDEQGKPITLEQVETPPFPEGTYDPLEATSTPPFYTEKPLPKSSPQTKRFRRILAEAKKKGLDITR